MITDDKKNNIIFLCLFGKRMEIKTRTTVLCVCVQKLIMIKIKNEKKKKEIYSTLTYTLKAHKQNDMNLDCMGQLKSVSQNKND